MTSLTSLDISASFNLIAGGTTASKELVPQATNQKGLLLFYEQGTFLKWAKYIDDARRRVYLVSVVKFTHN